LPSAAAATQPTQAFAGEGSGRSPRPADRSWAPQSQRSGPAQSQSQCVIPLADLACNDSAAAARFEQVRSRKRTDGFDRANESARVSSAPAAKVRIATAGSADSHRQEKECWEGSGGAVVRVAPGASGRHEPAPCSSLRKLDAMDSSTLSPRCLAHQVLEVLDQALDYTQQLERLTA